MHRGSRNTDTARHAEHNRVGRVFLVGDAAHIHLPVGGRGLNAGAQDAANLVWKFATEVQGRASKHLRTGPRSHEAERLPVARRPPAGGQHPRPGRRIDELHRCQRRSARSPR